MSTVETGTTMPVRKRGGVWWLDLHQAGQRIRRPCPKKVTSHTAALSYERGVLADLRLGLDPFAQDTAAPAPSAAPTIAEYTDRYLREQTIAAGLKAATTKSKRAIIATWIVPVVGARRVDEVRTADFTALRTAMAQAGRCGKTTNNVLAVLSSIVKFWHEQNDRTAPHFRTGRVKVARRTRPKFFTDDECARLVANAGADMLAMLLLGIDAGLRMSEIRALQVPDLQFGQRSTVTVSRTREDGEGDGDEDAEPAPKGWTSRTVKLTPRLVAALRALPRALHDPHVFLTRDEPLTRRMVSRKFDTLRRRAGIARGTFHWTRHTFCTRLAMAGVPARTIQELAGHADLATTMQYMWCAPGATDAGIDRLDGTVSSQPVSTGSQNAAEPAVSLVLNGGG